MCYFVYLQKNRRRYDDWQAVKAEVREEQRQELEEKLALQQRLIHAQDQLHLQLQEEVKQEQSQVTIVCCSFPFFFFLYKLLCKKHNAAIDNLQRLTDYF